MLQPLIKQNQPHLKGLRQLAPLTETRRWPWKILMPLLIMALLIPAVILLASRHSAPSVLSEGRLVGGRSPVPLAVMLVLDDSGSFASYARMRLTALDQVAQWVPVNLRSDDTLTVITFADSAYLTLPTTTVADLASRRPTYQDGDVGSGTAIQPALQAAVEAAPDDMMSTLVVVTDTEIADGGDTNAIQSFVKQLDAPTMSVITPNGIGVQAGWKTAFPWEAEFHADPDNADDIALAVGQALAHATGQELERA